MIRVMKAGLCTALSVALAGTFISAPAVAAWADEQGGSGQEQSELTTAQQEVKALIEGLADIDLFTISEADRERVAQAQDAFEALSQDEQKWFDDNGESSTRSYACQLESAVWGLDLLAPYDNKASLPDGHYISGITGKSNIGKYTPTSPRTWSVANVRIENGAAFATIKCNETGNYPQMRTGTGVYDALVEVDDEGKSHTSFDNVPVTLGQTMTFAVKPGKYGSVVVYKFHIQVDENALLTHEIRFAKAKASLSATSYAYNAKRPSVSVTYSGELLAEGVDYQVSYPKDSTSVGAHKVLVTPTYGAVKQLSYKVLPKATKLTKVKPLNGALKAIWKAQPVQTSGYQLQCCANKKFSGKTLKTKTIKGAKAKAVKQGKLKKGKKYFVRVRTFKKVGSVKYYSSWSNVKKAKVK